MRERYVATAKRRGKWFRGCHLKRKIVVTGGAGFLGSHLAHYLSPRAQVVAIDNLTTGNESNLSALGRSRAPRLIQADVLDYDLLLSVFHNASAVFHFAGLTSAINSFANPSSYEKVNVIGSLRVLMAAKARRVPRVVLASSAAVYGDSAIIPNRENVCPNPLSPYAVSKVVAEQHFRAFNDHGMETIILRFFNAYGPRQRVDSPYTGVVPKFAMQLLTNRTPIIYGSGKQTRDFIYASDVARATALALEHGAGGSTYNIATGRATSILEIANLLADIVGVDIMPAHHEHRQGDILHSWADISLAKRELGFESQTAIRDGLMMTLEAFRRGMLVETECHKSKAWED